MTTSSDSPATGTDDEGADATGGSAESASTEDPPGDMAPSAGCGTPTRDAGTVELTIDAGGANRQVFVMIPPGYDPEQPYPIVYNWHGLGGDAQQSTTWLGVPHASAGEAILVYPQGEGGSYEPANQWDLAYPDIAAYMGDNYCVDENRIYSISYSGGGALNVYLACIYDDFAAGVKVSNLNGWPTDEELIAGGNPPCFHNPFMFIYNENDGNFDWQGAADEILLYSGCSAEGGEASMFGANDCLHYTDCTDGPARVCTYDSPGDPHAWLNEHQDAIWDFLAPISK